MSELTEDFFYEIVLKPILSTQRIFPVTTNQKLYRPVSKIVFAHADKPRPVENPGRAAERVIPHPS